MSCDLVKVEGTNTNYVVLADRYSGYPFIAPLKTTTTAAVISKLENWFYDLRFPDILRSDNGPQYASLEFEQWCNLHNIIHEFSSPHYAQSNGHAESAVKAMQHLLCKTGGKFSTDFRKGFIAFKETPRANTSYSPSDLFFSFHFLSQMPMLHSQRKPIDLSKAAEEQAKVNERQKEAYDRHAKPLKPLKIGAHVYVQDTESKRWTKDGIVKSCSETDNSYVVEVDGKRYTRNRIFLRENKSESKCKKRVSWGVVKVYEDHANSAISNRTRSRTRENDKPP